MHHTCQIKRFLLDNDKLRTSTTSSLDQIRLAYHKKKLRRQWTAARAKRKTSRSCTVHRQCKSVSHDKVATPGNVVRVKAAPNYRQLVTWMKNSGTQLFQKGQKTRIWILKFRSSQLMGNGKLFTHRTTCNGLIRIQRCQRRVKWHIRILMLINRNVMRKDNLSSSQLS
jgi:hypothetical protein